MAKNVLWSLERIQEGLRRFYKEHDRYPTATEFDEYPYLPRTKTIERRFGGLVALRNQLKLGSERDLRTGAHSSKRAHTINARAHSFEQTVYTFLCKRFGKEFVHREFFFSDDHRTRADFFIYDKQGGFCVDTFYPNDRHNLTGCLNSKLKTYGSAPMRQYPVLFIQMNESILDEVLKDLLKRKKSQLGSGQHLMGWPAFQQFCSKREALMILRSKK